MTSEGDVLGGIFMGLRRLVAQLRIACATAWVSDRLTRYLQMWTRKAWSFAGWLLEYRRASKSGRGEWGERSGTGAGGERV